MIDLPGTYSFSSYSLEERVAKEFIIDENPDVIVNVVDASNIKRNLYLTFQLLEIGIPVIVVLNMMDVAKRREIEIDSKKIAKMLNCPVIEATGSKGIGSEEIMQNIVNIASNNQQYEDFKINYEELEPHINAIEEKISSSTSPLNKRWLAIKLLEGDTSITEHLKEEYQNIEEDVKKEENIFMKNMNKDSPSFWLRLDMSLPI